mmetsp:Transcript_16601/g.53287  ORF Transcript_16601/g.53287 Transcript_16601/m.53287 type:complete len:239 (-) Transcript_16601:58-774(-)
MQVGVVLECPEDAHHEVLPQELLVEAGVVEQDEALEDAVEVMQIVGALEVLGHAEDAHQLRHVVRLQQQLNEARSPERRHLAEKVGDCCHIAQLGSRQLQRCVGAGAARRAARPFGVARAARAVRITALQRADLLPEVGAALRVLKAQRVVHARLWLVPGDNCLLLPLVDVLHVHPRLQQHLAAVILADDDDKGRLVLQRVLHCRVAGPPIVPLAVAVEAVHLGTVARVVRLGLRHVP